MEKGKIPPASTLPARVSQASFGDEVKMEFYDVVKTRRSVRSYRSEPIPEDVLNRVLEAVRIAPSGSNRQPWRFIIVKDEAMKQLLVPACNGQSWIADAPIVVVACGRNLHYNRGGYMGEMSVLVDVAIAFTHLILAARAEGLGTCWIGAFNNDQVKEMLGVPEDYNVVAITPLGYPEGQPFTSPGKRKPLAEVMSIDHF